MSAHHRNRHRAPTPANPAQPANAEPPPPAPEPEAVAPELAGAAQPEAAAAEAAVAAQAAPAAEPAPPPPAAPAVPDGYMVDARGRLIPVTMVKAEELLEDQLVRAQFAKAVEASERLRAFRDAALADVGAFLDLLADRYKASRGGAKGNVTLSTFDGLLRIQLAVSDQLTFGPGLQVAKNLVDECIRAWSTGADAKLLAIVNDAFAVDKEGKLNVGRILELRRLSIEDETWARAMAAIGDAVRVAQSKQYLRFYRRQKPDAKMEQVPLDLASL